jgi:uncharacterized membrane protein
MKIIEVFKNNPTNFLTYGVLASVLTVILGSFFLPSIFYDNWIWKYYWGPVVADAETQPNMIPGEAVHNGVYASEGYTLVSEITYGIILIIALFFIYKLLKHLKIKVDWKFALALMPYILFGPITRVLEDTGYFKSPVVYWFISPLIYLQIAIYAIFFLLLGYYLEKRFKNDKITLNRVLFFGGVIILLPALALIGSWIAGNYWGPTSGVRYDVFLIVCFFLIVIVGLVYFIAHIFRENKKIVVYKNPLNLALIFGHMLDGITSYISIKDPFSMGLNYAEKHPASNLLIETWGPLFPITKFVLIIIVIYIFDIYYKEELRKYSTLTNLLKIGILILGFSPGLRDILRVTMGV